MRYNLPDTATLDFKRLCETVEVMYFHPDKYGPLMRETVLTQWALESGWGTSRLAKEYLNFAGMKWRYGMAPWATAVAYTAHDGRTEYCKFKSLELFVQGYFARLDLMDAYDGWREAANKGGDAFINHIGPPWYGLDPKANQQYVRKVLALREARFGGR